MQLLYNGVRLSLQRSYSVLLDNVSGMTLRLFKIYKYFSVYGHKLIRRQLVSQDETLEASILRFF